MLYIEGIENYTFEGREKYRNISLENYICGDLSILVIMYAYLYYSTVVVVGIRIVFFILGIQTQTDNH